MFTKKSGSISKTMKPKGAGISPAKTGSTGAVSSVKTASAGLKGKSY